MTVRWTECLEYDEQKIKECISRIIKDADFPDIAGKKVLLKPNMLGAFSPDKHVTTHPAFLDAVINICIERGAKEVWVGDSHNGLFPTKSVWAKTGIVDICDKNKATIKTFEEAVIKNDLPIAKAVSDADVVISLPKLKTHGLTLLTCAVKNMFGCIPGMKKSECHRSHIERRKFDEFLTRLAVMIKPAYTIVDGIIGMEGNGPSGGNLRELELVICGDDVFEVDELACLLLGIEPTKLGTLMEANEMGLWKPSLSQRKVVDDFKLPVTFKTGSGNWWLSRFVLRIIFGQARISPKFMHDKCMKCYHCLDICPAKAISKDKNGFPRVDKKKCFECFCCHESCAFKAIELKPSIGVRLVRWMGNTKN